MAKAKLTKKQQNSLSLGKRITAFPMLLLKRIGRGLAIITKPIRNSRLWKLLRRTVLKSPFKGYFADSWRELRQVTWPTRRNTWRLTGVVVCFSLFFAILLAAMDYGLEEIAKRVFLQ